MGEVHTFTTIVHFKILTVKTTFKSVDF